MFGYGAVLPFEIIYLHDGRGFGLSVAGLITGTITGAAVVTAPLAGPLIDRFGARSATIAAGAGNGAMNPGQSALLAALAPRGLRHRATAVSRVAGNAGIGAGGALGGLVAASGLDGFIALFLLNAVTYLGYVCVLAAVVRDPARPEPAAGGYRLVARDHAFMRLAVTYMAMIAVGWG